MEVDKEKKKVHFHFKGYGHNTNEWRDYNEDNVPFKQLQKVYVPDEDSLKERMKIFHGQLYSLYRDIHKFRLPFYKE